MICAVLDACVLYKAALRDLFMHLTVEFVFQPKWTAEIHSEWIDNVVRQRPDIERECLERTRDLMNRWARDWQVPDCQALAQTLTLPDMDDRHVLAAAIAAGVPLIVTFNLSDFPVAALSPHGIRAVHPDEFACVLLDDAHDEFLAAVRSHRVSLKHPPKSAGEYLETLTACGLKRAADRLSGYAGEI